MKTRSPAHPNDMQTRLTRNSIFLILLFLLPAAAEIVSELDELVVEGRPVLEEAAVRTDGSLVNVVGQDQIEGMNAGDLAAALRRVPGVSVSRFNLVGAFGGGDGGAVFVRGHGSGRPGSEIVTMLDGVPRFNGVWTHPLLDMLAVDNAKSIEVLKTPQPVLLGNMAFGAVNIVPKSMEDRGCRTRLTGSAASHDTFFQLVENGYSDNRLSSWITASHRSSNGHRANAGGEVSNLFGNFGVRLDDHWRVRLLANVTDGRASDPRAVGAPVIPLVEEYETVSEFFVLTLEHEHERASGFLKLFHESGRTEWLQWDAAFPPPVNQAFTNVSDFESHGLRVQERIEADHGLAFTLGWDLHFYGGEARDIYPAAPGAGTQFADRMFRNNAFYGMAEWQLEPAGGGTLTPSAGARFNDSREFDDQWGAQAGLVWERGGTKLFANFARAFNYAGVYAAVLNGNWAAFPVAPNAWRSLDPETLEHFELGFEREWAPELRTVVTAYHDRVSDAIRFDAPPPPVAITNIGSYEVIGIEGYAFWNPVAGLELFLGGAWQDADPGNTPNHPEWSASLGGRWEFADRWTLHWDAQYVGAQFTQGTRFSPGVQRVDDYLLVNARVARAFEAGKLGGKVFLAVENLTDEDYEFRPGYPMPGIMPTLGFELVF